MTTIPRLHVPDDLAAGATIAAATAQAHYLGTVLRCGAGDRVRLFNGRDGEWHARIAQLRRDRVTFAVETQLRPQQPDPDLWLVFALLKRDATDLVVQKATELGVSALLPIFTERTNTARINEARLTAIATEAAEQCERLDHPRPAPANPPPRPARNLAGRPRPLRRHRTRPSRKANARHTAGRPAGRPRRRLHALRA